MTGPRIAVGTSGYYFKDWVGTFYPEGTKSPEMLRLYAERFDTVELNFTYYGLPAASRMEKMARSTPEGFLFFAKAHKTITHERDLSQVPGLLEGLRPLGESGKLAGVLAQFPQSFKNTPPNRDHVRQVAGSLAGLSVAVEFRDRSWDDEEAFALLEEAGIHFVAVDEPRISTLMPIVPRATAGVGYIRFHSRDAENWYKGGALRYSYDYSDRELAEWLPRIASMLERAGTIFIYFNNCCRGAAAINAARMKELLEGLAPQGRPAAAAAEGCP